MSVGATIAVNDRHRWSRWHAVPLAAWLADRLAHSSLRPWQVTCAGLVCTLAAAAMLCVAPTWHLAAAALVWAAWLCDRLDGALARRQSTATAWGGWLDANVDELGDVAIHAGIAAAFATEISSAVWALFAAFVVGKYLLVAGLRFEEQVVAASTAPLGARAAPGAASRARRLYHELGDADLRLHLLLAALVCRAWLPELIFVASYYNLRWMVRYVLVARRLCGGAP
ncbi:MAG: CDP-alcohol phosphatidyltransferase family protein [Pirellulales bacterium]|nr:CDP-alcohol phosphatidyltransferase family protein [Pirellulales bacterium]